MTNAESGLIQLLWILKPAVLHSAQLMSTPGKGEGEESFPLSWYFIGKLSLEEAQRVMRENYIC